ncbi:MAG: hypothetical protein HYY04_05100 [Chloroflexi bacterium]|nr:hypothetical protein [Chloroflexota bacterium]
MNVRTGTPAEAAAWVAYCNEPADGPQGSRRAANGHPEPFGVRIWDVGNEGWDLGAEWYAHRFLEYARAMRAVDPAIKLVAVGHNGGRRDRAWDETIVRIAGREIDAIAPHHYVGHRVKSLDGDGVHYYANVACAKPVEETLAFDVQLLDSQLPDRPEVAIAMDEWGVWTQIDQGMRHNYDLSDALVAAAVLNAIQRQARRVRIANWAQIVDCLGLIQARRDLVWTTPVYEAYRLYATICGAEVCPCVVTCATYDTGPVAGLRRPLPPITDVPYLDAGATRDPDGRRVVLTVVNRHLTQPMDCHLDLAGLPPDPVIRVEELNHPDVFAMNTAGAPTTIQVIERTLSSLGATFRFPAHSLTVIELRSR